MIKKLVIIFILFIVPVSTCALTDGTKRETVILNKCVDGDTARFKRGANEIKVRLLGVDTPETVDPRKEVEEYGQAASNFTCEILTNSKSIILEYDPKSDEKDKYDRYLAWVYVDDVLLQDLLVKEGYAKVAYLYDDYLYTNLLYESENIAKEEKKGIWSKEEITTQKDHTTTNSIIKNKSIIDQVIDFINEVLDKIIKFIDKLIEDML